MAKVVARRNPSVTKLTDVESRKLLGQITAMALEHVAIDAVKPNPRNAKQHPEQQVLLIAENIRKFGVNHPLDDANLAEPSWRGPGSAGDHPAVVIASEALKALGENEPGTLKTQES